MENLFDTEVGLALAGLLALLGYLGLLIEHPKPERQKKRERIAHRALVLAAVIEFACALATVAAAHGWHPFPAHRLEAPIVQPVPGGDLSKLAKLPWMAGTRPAVTVVGDNRREAEPSDHRGV
jgi:hypothetical protein